jgi:hypothetical protein
MFLARKNECDVPLGALSQPAMMSRAGGKVW